MNLIFDTLKLFCRGSEETVIFGPRLSFFYGEMSSGKSSIAELIEYCLGGSLTQTPAISSEIVSVQLTVMSDNKRILIERDLETKTSVEVSWEFDAERGRERIPTQAGKSPIVGEDVFNLSDFLMKFIGLPIIKVRQSKRDPESSLWRLGFRDFYEFCYLDQRHLDSSLFLLEQPIRAEKSKDVLRYVLGFHSDRLNELQGQLADLRQDQRTMREAADQIGEFLGKYGFSSQKEIEDEIRSLSAEALELEESISSQSEAAQQTTTVDEEIQASLGKCRSELESKKQAIIEIQTRIEEQDSLVAEFIAMKFKAARSSLASELLGRASFDACPLCGTSTDNASGPDACMLCKAPLAEAPGRLDFDTSIVERDLSDRVEELKKSLARLRRSLDRQTKAADDIRAKRAEVQQQLDFRRRSVESEYMKRARHLEATLGGVKERIRFLNKVKEMPIEIESKRIQADALSAKISTVQRQIGEEEARFEIGRSNVAVLEQNFLDTLQAIHFPEISENDEVRMNLRSWMPYIYPNGESRRAWTFDDAGSGGKMVLFKISFALALHLTASQRQLPLPRILVIDSTMKNITPDVNPEVFENFYRELYRLLATELGGWQMILIDQTFNPPAEAIDGFVSRKLTTSDDNNPPLISYYRGH